MRWPCKKGAVSEVRTSLVSGKQKARPGQLLFSFYEVVWVARASAPTSNFQYADFHGVGVVLVVNAGGSLYSIFVYAVISASGHTCNEYQWWFVQGMRRTHPSLVATSAKPIHGDPVSVP